MSAPEGGHVLVIGVDGVRFDFLGPESAPSIWALGQAGFLAPVPVDEATPTWSGPCWATIATGTGVAGHGITGNDLTGHRLAEHPDFVTLATRAGLPTLLAVSGWPPLALAEDGGPLFAEASRREFVAVPEAGLAWDDAGRRPELAAWDAADEAITARAAAILAADRLPGCRSSTWARSTSPGTRPAPGPPTGRRCGPPTSGWGGWWRRSAPGRPARGGLDDRGGHRPRAPGRGRSRRARARGHDRVGGRRGTRDPAGRPPLITRQEEVAPLVLAAAGVAGLAAARTA